MTQATIVYSAVDQGDNRYYNAEAIVSAASVKRYTRCRVKIYTNRPDFLQSFPLVKDVVDEIAVIKPEVKPKEAKIRAINDAKGWTVFLDTHTVVLDAVENLLHVGEWDFAAAPAPWRQNIQSMQSESDAKREFDTRYSLNSGVLFIRPDRCRDVFRVWLAEYQKALFTKGGSPQDQPALLRACRRVNPSVWRLAPNYNFRPHGGAISGKLFIWHCHHLPDIKELLRENLQASAVNLFIDKVAQINDSYDQVIVPKILQSKPISLSLSRQQLLKEWFNNRKIATWP